MLIGLCSLTKASYHLIQGSFIVKSLTQLQIKTTGPRAIKQSGFTEHTKSKIVPKENYNHLMIIQNIKFTKT